MKKITAIVRPEKLEPLKDALFAAKVSGMTVSQVQGCGSQHGWKEYYRGTEVLLNMVPKVKFEIICDDAEVDALIDVISATTRWCASAPANVETRRFSLSRASCDCDVPIRSLRTSHFPETGMRGLPICACASPWLRPMEWL